MSTENEECCEYEQRAFIGQPTQTLRCGATYILDTIHLSSTASTTSKKLTQSDDTRGETTDIFVRSQQWVKIYDIFTRSAAVKEIYNRVSIYLWRVKSVFSFRWNINRVWRALESGEGKKVFLAYFSIENCNFSSQIFLMRNIRVKWAKLFCCRVFDFLSSHWWI